MFLFLSQFKNKHSKKLYSSELHNIIRHNELFFLMIGRDIQKKGCENSRSSKKEKFNDLNKIKCKLKDKLYSVDSLNTFAYTSL